MKNNKNIDHLYLRKFKDVEITPPEMAWQNISTRLPVEEKKWKTLPLWYKIAGVAAVVALFLGLNSSFFESQKRVVSTPSFTTKQNIEKEIQLASTFFNEGMFKSSLLLQALTQQRRTEEFEGSSEGKEEPSPFKYYALVNRLKDFRVMDFQDQEVSFLSFSRLAQVDKKGNQEVITESKGRDLAEVLEGEKDFFEEPREEKTKAGRLSISTKVAPIYFDHMGSGNTMNNQFSNNSGSGEFSLSYGINLAYQISDDLKIRSGINKVDLGYHTKDVSFSSAVMAVSGDERSLPVSLAASPSGELNQSLGFIEVPLELEYRLIDQKIGLSLIGGGSSLFLNNNSISFSSQNTSTRLGEANNLNNLSFSANLGIGLDYEISPQFELNLEPIFKYQLNTFKDVPDLNPYYFGIYSGFSFSF